MPSPRNEPSIWPVWLANEDAKLVHFLAEHNVRNDETYETLRYNGPTDVMAELDLKRLQYYEKSIPSNDPVCLLRLAPLWVRFVDITDLVSTVRVKNVLNFMGIALVGDLLDYTSPQLLNFQNMGQKSLRELSRSILQLSEQPENTAHYASPLEAHTNLSSWYQKLLDEIPALQSILEANQIDNATSYLEKRRQLPEQLRKQIDSYRFRSLLPDINDNNPLDLLGICPTWMLDMNIRYFRTSTRMKNIISEQGINKLSDFLDFEITGLSRMNNTGRTTLNQFYSDILHANKKGPPPTFDVPLVNKLSLRESFQRTFDALEDEKYRYVIEKRLGVGCSAETLETIGETLGVTRERIRQLQKKIIGAIIDEEFWDDSLKFKLQRVLQDKHSPVFLEELQSNDPWFDGFQETPELLKNIISFFSHLNVNFIQHNERTILADIRGDEFDDLVSGLAQNLDETLSIGYSYDDVEALIEHTLSEHDAQELTDIVFAQLSEQLNFVSKDNQLVLASVGNGRRSRLTAILEKSPTPLHYSEITNIYREQFEYDVTERSIHAALNTYEFWLYGRGQYGLSKHLPRTEDSLRSITSIAFEHVKSNPERQWHSSELLKVVGQDESQHDIRRVDKYVLNICLHQFSDLQYLGKMVWVFPDADGSFNERIFIKDAVIEALQENGQPMTVSALEKEVLKKRGTPVNFETQLNTIARIGRIAPGTWGLIYRDFEGNEVYWEAILTMLIDHLQNSNIALHKSELLTALKSESISSVPKVNLIYGIVQADGRFRGWLGGFVGLKDWSTPRRLTLVEGVEKLLNDGMAEFTLDELKEKLRSLISYAYSPTALSVILKNNGVVYDKDNRIWSVTPPTRFQ
jgi:hypothetical protein